MKTTRDSNMELLRLVAMLLVMIIHASYRALPHPTPDSLAQAPLSGFLQLTTQSFSVMAVNVFVLLSGWYGIRLRLNRIAELLFQVLFFGILCLAVLYAVQGSFPSGALNSLFMLGESDYWFVKTYLALYLLSPVLNAYVAQASRRQMELTLILLFLFQWVFGWVFEATTWLRAGYSLPSFLCLYLLARYVNVHRPRFARFSRRADLTLFVVICSLTALTTFYLKRHFDLGGVLFFYNSPNVILSALFLLLFFSKMQLRSRVVNWLAVSALAIYLTHSSSFIGQFYDGTILRWHGELSLPLFVISTAALILAVFFASILIDKLRLLLWRPIEKAFPKSR